jgi:hypothetical protein
MADGRTVFVEGVEESSRPPTRPPSGWIWLAIGLLIGFGLALVVLTGADTPDAVAETGTTVATPETLAVGVADHVAGFEDDLVVVSVGDGQNLDKVLWPANDKRIVTQLTPSADSIVEIDNSGQWMAIGAPVGIEGQLFLTVGTTTSNVALDSSATGFSWHDTAPGSLAFSRAGSQDWRLVTAQPPSLPRPVDVPAGTDGYLVAFGDWGYVLQSRGEAYVLGRTGEVVMVIPGMVLDSHPDVGLVVLNGEVSGVGFDQKPFEIQGSFSKLEPLAAAISPDGAKVAVTGSRGVKVSPLGDSGQVTEMFTTSSPRSIAWTSDSRFVVVPLVRGLAVIDTIQGGVPVVLLEHLQVVAVGTVPGGAGRDTLFPWQR